jgi:hypothetical protein
MELSREIVLQEISNAALFGSLGLFVGTGFSKAITDGEAPSFQELLREVCHDIGIEFDFDDPEGLRGKSYSRIAQELVAKIQETAARRISARRAALKLKRSVCKACDLIPIGNTANSFREVLKDIPIQWVITTNYDFLLEDSITGSVCLLPDQILNVRNDYIPIYHLHGHRRSPSSIIITDSDYVKLLTPIEYRQVKLNLLLAESTTVMLGYSFGDVNVQSAMEWSRTFRDERGLRNESYQSLVIQALYVHEEPEELPYKGRNGEIIIETDDLLSFLTEIQEVISIRRLEHEEVVERLSGWLDEERSPSLVADDPDVRQDFIETIIQFPRCYDIHKIIDFLSSVLNPIWEQAREAGGFTHYARFLNVLLDIVINLPAENIHPSLFSYLADRLSDVSYYMEEDVRHSTGTAWEATDTWHRRKEDIPPDMKRELMRFSKRHGGRKLLRLFR